MLRLLTVMLFSLFTAFAHADDLEDADKAWSPGKPWPAHWGLITYPYADGWNTVMVMFVNKVYSANEAADTRLKNIPHALKQDAAVEICPFKRGLLKLATHCQAAIVDPEIIGTLKKNDLVALFYPNHGTRRFSKGPGSDARTTMRVFQKLSDGDDPACWESLIIMSAPIAAVCRDRINRDQVSRILTRDFGPRGGVDLVNPVATSAETSVKATVAPATPSPDAIPAQMPSAVDPKVPVVEVKLEASDQSSVPDGQ
jgi:hypothetical protein